MKEEIKKKFIERGWTTTLEKILSKEESTISRFFAPESTDCLLCGAEVYSVNQLTHAEYHLSLEKLIDEANEWH